VKNPVIFVVEVGAVLITVLLVRDLLIGASGIGFSFQISLWLWFTVLFANFAEAMAEARGKAQAEALRKQRQRRWQSVWDPRERSLRLPVPLAGWRRGALRSGRSDSRDGEVIEGIARLMNL